MIKHNRIFVTLAATIILTIALTGCGKAKEQVNVVDNSKPQKETTVKTPEAPKTPVVKSGYENTYPEKDLSSFASEEEKIEYLAKKFVIDDLTKKFENKETLTVTDAKGVMVGSFIYDGTKSMVFDLPTLVPTQEERVWDKEVYKKFIGFESYDIFSSYYEEEKIEEIVLESNLAPSIYDESTWPLFELTIKVSVNEVCKQ